MKCKKMALVSLIALSAASCGQTGPLYLPAEAPPKGAPGQPTKAQTKQTETKSYQTPLESPTLYQNLPESGMYEPQ